MRDLAQINQMLAEMEGELQRLDLRRTELLALISDLKEQKAAWRPAPETLLRPETSSAVTHASPEAAKIALYRSLFRGREDVYRAGSRAPGLARQAINRLAATSGSVGSAKNRRCAVTLAPTVTSCRSPTRRYATTCAERT